jgi:deazaflavin-dependent oxidoreductase (nitroreductase family)
MEPDEKIFDSPVGNVREHIREYVTSEGEKGHLYRGWPTLLLTTRGRKSGRLRRTALIYGRDGESYLLVASNRGSRKQPNWYLNLLEAPLVYIQVGAEQFNAQARIATAEEKPRLWQIMLGINPEFNRYQKKAGREIDLVIVEREAHAQCYSSNGGL